MDRDTADRSVSVRITIGKKTRWRHFVTSLPLLIVFILSLLMNGKFKPLAQRGFFCDDNSIRYPIKSDTIGMKTLFLFALFIPGLLIKFCDRTITRLADSYNSRRRRKSSDAARLDFEQETLIPHSNGRRRKQVGESSSNSRDSDQEAVDSTECKPSTSESGSDFGEVELFNKASWDRNTEPLSGGQTWSKFDSNPFGFRMFFFGLTTTLFFAGLGKLACGRLRPHFMQACNPDIDCSAKENSLKYIESFVCKNIAMDSPSFSYITTSWPSGHAALIFYSMLYLVIYLDKVVPTLVQFSSSRFRKLYDPMGLYLLFTIMLSLASYISMTRISDYQHHPLDVVSGSILGSTIALAMTRSIPSKVLSGL